MFLPLCFFTFLPLSAQTFIQDIQKSNKGEGTVTIHQDKAIDALVNAPANTTPKQTTTPPKQQEKKADKTDKTDATAPNGTNASNADEQQQEEETTIPRRTRKTMGYKVQAFAGRNTRADRRKAEQTASAIRSLMPGEKVETHFVNPRWLCLVGNFTTYADAQTTLSELRKLGYSSATIVKSKVTIAY